MIHPIAALLEEHRSRRPEMELRDLYKLLYQSVRGPEHSMPSAEIFTQRLAEEWQSLTPSEADPLYEAIRPDRSLLRLNLRPYKAAGGSLDELVAACLETGRRTWGTQVDLLQSWGEFLVLCRAGYFPNLALADCESFTSWLQAQGFPPVHHSERYRSLYHPAYRLVAADLGFLE